jgi:putative ABC transport system permease protein
MLYHYLKVALRNIFRNKLFSFINILSIAVGLSSFLLFLMYLLNETTYDRFNKNANSIYRVYEWSKAQNGAAYSGDAWLYLPLGPALKKDFPDVRSFVRLVSDDNPIEVKYGENDIKLQVTYADTSFFEFFPSSAVYGGSAISFSNINDVILTRKDSRLLFGAADPIGKTISIKTGEDFHNFDVTGVTENPPSNTSVSFDLLLNIEFFESSRMGKIAAASWNFSGFQNFVRLDPASTLAKQPQRLAGFRKKYFPAETPPVAFRLQPLTDIHRNLSITAGSASHPIDTNAIRILFGIALGILTIGCINFTTIATARSAKRSREIGVRKVIGGQKAQIVTQFLMESFLLSAIAGALALLLAWVFLPVFNTLVKVNLHFSLFRYSGLCWIFLAVVAIAGLLAGIYPAGVLANLKIVAVLKNRFRINGSTFFMKGLLTTQYFLSIGLIISTVVIGRQTNYMRTMDLGFNKDNVITLNAAGIDGKKALPLFANELATDDQVLGITSSGGRFWEAYNSSGFDYHGKNHQVINFSSGTNFLSVMGMRLVAGRLLDDRRREDTVNSVIVNEALVRDLGLSDQTILGLKLTGYSANPTEDPVVVGVVKDYHLLPVRQRIVPTLFREKNTYRPLLFYVHIKPGNPTHALAAIKAAWGHATNGGLFDYGFLDEQLNTRYQQERRLGDIVEYAAAVCIFLAGLGLGGLAYLNSENRTKELVIRKIFGGSWTDILYLLAKEFLKLVLLAYVVAVIGSSYFLHGWLEGYASRISVGLWTYILPGIGALLFTFLILGTTLGKIVVMKPVKGLLTE